MGDRLVLVALIGGPLDGRVIEVQEDAGPLLEVASISHVWADKEFHGYRLQSMGPEIREAVHGGRIR